MKSSFHQPLLIALLSLGTAAFLGCKPETGQPSTPAEKPPPAFSLAWSEYPAWSAFGVAHVYKIIDGREG